MNKLIVSMSSMALLPLVSINAQNVQQGEQVTLQVNILNPDELLNGGPKGPVQVPYVTLDDHTLYIWSQHNGFTLTLIDDNDTVVYQTYLFAGVQYDVLPATLSGTFTLILSDDTYMYTGTIGLE